MGADIMAVHDEIDGIERELKEKFGIETSIHMDPIATDDERVNRLHGQVAQLVRGKYQKIYYGPEEDGPYSLIYNRVLALLLSIEGVENFSALTVNGTTADVMFQADQVPVLKEVSVT